MDPPVSEPNAATHSSAATAAAAPPLEPPGTQCRFQGFLLGPNAEFSVDDPIANSSRLVLPRRMDCCSFSFAITVASYGGMKFCSMRDAQVVATPSVQRLSLIASGMPVIGFVLRHPFNFSSRAAACARAESFVCVR